MSKIMLMVSKETVGKIIRQNGVMTLSVTDISDCIADANAEIDRIKREVGHTTAETIEMVIGTIALDQGWEETGDKYRKMFGLPTLYEKMGEK